MDWLENDESGYQTAIGDNSLTYWVGNDGLEGSPVFGMFESQGIDTAVFRGPKGSEDDARLVCEIHGKRYRGRHA
jgi:hypothetical protein